MILGRSKKRAQSRRINARVTQTNDTAPLTAEAFVAGLSAMGHHLCMGLGIKAPKGELGIGKDDGCAIDLKDATERRRADGAGRSYGTARRRGASDCHRHGGSARGVRDVAWSVPSHQAVRACYSASNGSSRVGPSAVPRVA